jgi:hypothetical protein
MKHWYENKVIVVLLIQCPSLEAKNCWPYAIESKTKTKTNNTK